MNNDSIDDDNDVGPADDDGDIDYEWGAVDVSLTYLRSRSYKFSCSGRSRTHV